MADTRIKAGDRVKVIKGKRAGEIHTVTHVYTSWGDGRERLGIDVRTGVSRYLVSSVELVPVPQPVATPVQDIAMVLCDNTLTHKAHRITGTWREECPGVNVDMIRMTQKIADLYTEVAGHYNNDISHYRSAWYAGMRETLTSSIQATYPDTDAHMVYELLIDSGESVAQCVDYWRQRNEEHEWCQQTYDSDTDDANLICVQHKTILTPGHVHRHDTEVKTSECPSGCKVFRCACGDERVLHELASRCLG